MESNASTTGPWSPALIDRARAYVTERLNEASAMPHERVRFCLKRIADGLEQDAEPLHHVFAFALAALDLHAEHGGLTEREVDLVTDAAERVLKLVGVKPIVSRLSSLHGEIHVRRARAMERGGKPLAALWTLHLAQLASRRAPVLTKAAELRAVAHLALRRGDGALCSALLAAIPAADEPLSTHLLRASLARLEGELDRAQAALASATRVAGTAGDADAARKAIAWEAALIACARARNPAPLIAAADGREPGEGTALSLLRAWLWSSAAASPEWSSRLPTLRTIRGKVGRADLSPGGAALFRCAQILAAAVDGERPLDQRVAAMAELLELAKAAPSVDDELAVLAATTRWMARYNQLALGAAVAGEYRALAARLSGGRVVDPTGLLADLQPERLLARYVEGREEAAVGTAASPKSAGLLRLLAGIAAITAKGAVGRLFTSPDRREAVDLRNSAELGQWIAKLLGRRKGVLLKLGQFFSYFQGPVGPALARELEVLQSQIEGMAPSAMRAVIESELGQPLETVFAEFDSTPFAAGSIGQVHRARLLDGTRVAVKVQYPFARDVIEFDTSQMRALKPVVRRIMPGMDWEVTVAEATAHFLDETDYRKEAANLEELRELISADDGVVVPGVVAAASGERVLTMDLMAGESFKEFRARASQEERDRAAHAIATVFFRGLYRWGFFNVDPQPGNFIFGDGKVALLDLGCVKRYPPAFKAQSTAFWRAFFSRDMETFTRLFVEIGWVGARERFDREEAYRLMMSLKRHAMYDAPYRLTPTDVTDIFEFTTRRSAMRGMLRMPRQLVMNTRIEFGLYSVIADLEADVNWYRVHCEALFGGMEAAPPPLGDALGGELAMVLQRGA